MHARQTLGYTPQTPILLLKSTQLLISLSIPLSVFILFSLKSNLIYQTHSGSESQLCPAQVPNRGSLCMPLKQQWQPSLHPHAATPCSSPQGSTRELPSETS
jgi:hypothetical protein